MRKILTLLLCIIIHDVSCSEQYNKATFQKIRDGYVVVFQNEKGEIRKIKKLKNNKTLKDLIVPDQQWNPFFLSEPWRQVLYSDLNANTIIYRYLTTTHSVYLFEERKKNFVGPTKVNELNRHNSPIETIAEINSNNERYLLSSSLYPSIKMYNVSSRREVECNGNQSYLLGGHNAFILYASVIEKRSMVTRWLKKKSINKCRVYVKNIPNVLSYIDYKKKPAFEKQVFNFKQDEKSKEEKSKEEVIGLHENNHLILTIGPGSIPLVAFSEETLEVPLVAFSEETLKAQKKQKIASAYAVLYDTSRKILYFINLREKKFFQYQLTDQMSYVSITVDVKDSFVEAYLLSDDSKNIKMVRLDEQSKQKTEKSFVLRLKAIAIAFYENNLLCATSNGQVKIVNIEKLKKQQVVNIEKGEDNSLLIKTTYEKFRKSKN